MTNNRLFFKNLHINRENLLTRSFGRGTDLICNNDTFSSNGGLLDI